MNLLLNTPPLNVGEQMAFDEILVRQRPHEVSFRFYNWGSFGPAVTFGYAQFIQEVRRVLENHRFLGDYTRRPTGGGVVFHTDDLTFSLVFEHAGRPVEIYEKLHAFILREIAKINPEKLTLEGQVSREFYKPSVQNQASACFLRPVENDILDEKGQKILGGAIRRFGTTVLYQGSLQVKHARNNPAYKNALTQAVRTFLGVDLFPRRADEQTLLAAKELAQTQYQTTAWKEKF